MLQNKYFLLDPQRVTSKYYKNGFFTNVEEGTFKSHSFKSILNWKFSKKEPPSLALPIRTLNKAPKVHHIHRDELIAPFNKIRITWLGHATTWISININNQITNILTDPVLGNIRPLIKRFSPLPVPIKKLHKIDIVLISHAHRDHYDIYSLRKIRKKNIFCMYLAPIGSKYFLEALQVNSYQCMEWWEKKNLDDIQIQFCPSQHWTKMWLHDYKQSHWGSYIIQVGKTKIYFGGDTAFASHFKELIKKNSQGFAATLLPIGAFRPRWFMKGAHMDPPEALKAAKILKSKMLLPIHWGTFKLADDYLSEPLLYLKECMRKEKKSMKVPAKFWMPGQHIDIKIEQKTKGRK